MRKSKLNATTFIIAAFLVSCTGNLGSDTVESVLVVRSESLRVRDQFMTQDYTRKSVVELKFSSNVNIMKITGRHDVIVQAGYCPLERDRLFSVFGPYSYVAEGISQDHLNKNVYVAYIEPSVLSVNKGQAQSGLSEYDLSNPAGDVCLRVVSTDNGVRRLTSHIFVAPARLLDKAFHARSAGPTRP